MSALLALRLALALGAAPAGCPEPSAEAALLAEYCADVAARPRLPPPTLEERRALRTVFERPELRRARTDTAGFRRLLLGLWGRVMELLGTAQAERFASVGRLVFILAGMAAALAALAALRRRRHVAVSRQVEESPALGRLPPPDRSAALADVALARGDLAGAIRHAFLSALAALEERGWVPRDRTLTNRELSGRLSPAGAPLAEEFRALGRLVDGVVYGAASPLEPEARSGLAVAARIRALARTGGAP